MQTIAQQRVQGLVVPIRVMGDALMMIHQFDAESYALEIDIQGVQGTQIIGFTIDAPTRRVTSYSDCLYWEKEYISFLEQSGFDCNLLQSSQTPYTNFATPMAA